MCNILGIFQCHIIKIYLGLCVETELNFPLGSSYLQIQERYEENVDFPILITCLVQQHVDGLRTQHETYLQLKKIAIIFNDLLCSVLALRASNK